jgi:putative oxidoreductase
MLGFLNPLGPLNIISSMTVAIRRAHWKFPVWTSAGGAELAATNLAGATVLLLSGPGRYSLDSALGIRFPRWLTAFAWLNIAAITTIAIRKPEIVSAVVNRAGSHMPAALKPTSDPDIVMETRPAASDVKQTTPEPAASS